MGLSFELHNTRPIAFFDSGVGGLPYLMITRRKAPGERYVYLADRANFPYGEKDTETLKKIVYEGVSKLVERENPKLVVIACNTASVVALSELRDKFNLPFVGVVPAVKPAASRCDGEKIAVLATKRTVEDEYLGNLIETYAKGCEVVKYPASGIVELVEKYYFSLTIDERIAQLQRALEGVRDLGVKSVVLGCTHFVLIREEIKEVLGSGIEVVDSTEGVSNQVIRVLESEGLKREIDRERELIDKLAGTGVYIEGMKNTISEDAFYLTGDPPFEDSYLRFAKKYGLQFMGKIDL